MMNVPDETTHEKFLEKLCTSFPVYYSGETTQKILPKLTILFHAYASNMKLLVKWFMTFDSLQAIKSWLEKSQFGESTLKNVAIKFSL